MYICIHTQIHTYISHHIHTHTHTYTHTYTQIHTYISHLGHVAAESQLATAELEASVLFKNLCMVCEYAFRYVCVCKCAECI